MTIIHKFIFFIFVFLSIPAYANEKLTVILDWLPNAGQAPLFVAQDKGFFRAEGLDVELIGPANPADPPKFVAAEKADIALTYEPQFMEQVDQGLPLIRIGTLVDQPLDCLVVLKNSGINSIQDLKGKSIGVSTGSINNVALKTMLVKHHLNLEDIHQVNVNYNLTQSLLSRKVDAVTGMMRTFEVIQLDLMNQPTRQFFPEENGVPSYSELIFVVNKKHIQDPRFRKFLIALKKGNAYLQKNSEETWKIFASHHPELNDELNHRAWFASLPYFSNYPASFDAKKWEIFANFLLQNGIIRKVQPIENYAVDLISSSPVMPARF
ncbi:MAG TPA: ABC transporter substrate-binding protein [Gammaproteobacteria bacterium]|jgi:putative hydroxymethylpyrimidine transport system substrate-binding protein|nr:ABC transporter substrate-binding protein [Gammaproteobacteria bacterium]